MAAAAEHELPPPAAMMGLITGYWVSQAVGVVAQLGVADQLGRGPRATDELARDVGAGCAAAVATASANASTRKGRVICGICVRSLNEWSVNRTARTAPSSTFRRLPTRWSRCVSAWCRPDPDLGVTARLWHSIRARCGRPEST